MQAIKPDWAPQGDSEGFAGYILTGIGDTDRTDEQSCRLTSQINRRRELSADEYIEGILACDRTILARAITLIESNAPRHFVFGQKILQRILPYTGKAIRVGITGAPGVGKSTFIEALGSYLCDQGKRVAVLAVDPSSNVSRGSILGDKTRMENLSRRSDAFIRPSPSGGTLGGVTRKSREALLLCEAAGFDIILVETVGVGQNETTVRSMVDFFLVLVITGAGDDLQGIKKGIIELADAILVNKADGDNIQRAQIAKVQLEQVLHYLRPATEGWIAKACTCSAATGEGIKEIWEVILEYIENIKRSGVLESMRQRQALSWVIQMAEDDIRSRVITHPTVVECMEHIEKQVHSGKITTTSAAGQLIKVIENIFINIERE